MQWKQWAAFIIPIPWDLPAKKSDANRNSSLERRNFANEIKLPCARKRRTAAGRGVAIIFGLSIMRKTNTTDWRKFSRDCSLFQTVHSKLAPVVQTLFDRNVLGVRTKGINRMKTKLQSELLSWSSDACFLGQFSCCQRWKNKNIKNISTLKMNEL